MLEKYEAIVPVDVSADLAAGEIMGFKEGKYVPAVVDATDNFTGDGVATTFNLSNKPVVYGSVTVTVDGTPTAVTVDYENGTITFDAAPASGAAIVATYKYYAATPSAILSEAVTAGQSPATAKMIFAGIVWATDVNTNQLLEEVKAKLREAGIYVEEPKNA